MYRTVVLYRDGCMYMTRYKQRRGVVTLNFYFASINAATALATALAPSRTASLSSFLTRGRIRPSNLSGWKRSIVPLSSSLRALAFPPSGSSTSKQTGKRNAEIPSDVSREMSALPHTGHGTSPKPRSADVDSTSPTHRRSYVSRASACRLRSRSSRPRRRPSSFALRIRAASACAAA